MSGAIDWDDAFDNSSYVPDGKKYFDKWAKAAANARQVLEPQLGLKYGVHEREAFDLFLPDQEPEGLVVFIHGGYWHLLDRSCFSHLATGCLAHKHAVALLSYPLAPEVAISTISRSVITGVECVAGMVEGPIRLAGHSAGGHLVCRSVCEDTTLSETTLKRIKNIVSISGVHDLRPLCHTKLNQTLGLSAEESEAESPALCSNPYNAPVHFWVGAQERPEFLRQTRLAAEKWNLAGLAVRETYVPAKHHFSVVEDLAHPDSALVDALLN